MKLKILSLSNNYVTWILNDVLGKCEIHADVVKRTYIPGGFFTLTPAAEKMVSDLVQQWYAMKGNS